MIQLPKNITDSVNSFSKLPGVGEKTALRQIMAMTKWTHEDLMHFSKSINSLIELKNCTDCGMFCDDTICEICESDRSENKVMCVVENISDLMAIENSETFKGVYHILGGVLNPLLGVGPEQLRIDTLNERIKRDSISTLILAVNPSVEGDATCSYIKQIAPDINIERIGFGVPMGGSLEFLDPLTISKALENRKEL